MNWGLFLNHFIKALLAIKLRIVLLGVIVIGLLGLYLIFEKPTYKTSWVLLLPGTERASTINLDNLGEARSNGGNAYGSVSISPKNTYKEIALSDAVINQAAEVYGVAAIAFSKPRITLIDQTPAMQFTLVGEEQEELSYRANLYNDVFHTTLDTLRKNEIDRNYLGIENNLAEAKARLAKARQDVVAHQTESNFISEQQFQRWMDDAELLRTEKTQADIRSAQLAATLTTSLRQLDISSAQAEALLLAISSPSIKTSLDRLSAQLTERTSHRSQFASENPIRKKTEREVNALTQEIRAKLAKVPNIEKISDNQLFSLLSESTKQNIQTVAAALAELDGLNAQSMALQSSQEQYQARIKAHTQDAATLSDLQRDHQIAEAIFSSALAKLDTSRLDIYATYPLTQLLTRPGATIKRDRLKSKLMIVAGILIFGMLSIAMTLAHMRKLLIPATQTEMTNTNPNINNTAVAGLA